jgi:carboxyl-terminal processing protease
MRLRWPNRELIRSLLLGVIGGVLLGGAFVGGYAVRSRMEQPPTSQASFALLYEADGLLQETFYTELPDERLRVYGAIHGLVGSLGDPYTIFVEPPAAEVDAYNLAGAFGGIGAEIGLDEQGHFVISRVYEDSPAAEAGVRVGDIIIAVDGESVESETPNIDDLLARIRGSVGEPVTITFLRDGERLELTMIRAEVLIPSVIAEILREDSRIGYIKITRFTERSPQEVEDAIRALRAQGAEAFVLDLRDNGGGLVDSAVGVASQFLSGGVVAREERGREAEQRVFNVQRGGAALTDPLVVLVNGQTASASEIVAGALQDRGRAALIGQTTLGKGSVQVILSLSDGSSLHVTNARWFTPNNRPLNGQGLEPDIPIEPVEETDAELAAAIDALSERLAVTETAQP